jgi:hypothetical protein
MNILFGWPHVYLSMCHSCYAQGLHEHRARWKSDRKEDTSVKMGHIRATLYTTHSACSAASVLVVDRTSMLISLKEGHKIVNNTPCTSFN